MKKIFFSLFLSFILAVSFSSIAYAFGDGALSDYTPLAPLPGTTNCANNQIQNTGATGNTSCKTNFPTYLPALFKFAVGFSAVLAFVMITFGGVMYATSDAISGKSQGREYIENAVWGLLLVIGAWAILNTINPQILQFKLDIPRAKLSFADINLIPGNPMSQAQIAGDQAARDALGSHITAYAGPCTNGETKGCVNLNGLQPQTITGLQTLQQNCNCDISIQGGTEPGHSTGSAHNTGNAVDFAATSDLNKTLTNNYQNSGSGTVNNGQLSACATISYNGGKYLWEPKGATCGGDVASSGDHWHVTY